MLLEYVCVSPFDLQRPGGIETRGIVTKDPGKDITPNP